MFVHLMMMMMIAAPPQPGRVLEGPATLRAGSRVSCSKHRERARVCCVCVVLCVLRRVCVCVACVCVVCVLCVCCVLCVFFFVHFFVHFLPEETLSIAAICTQHVLFHTQQHLIKKSDRARL